MKKKRFTGVQIAYTLAQESTGQTIAALTRVRMAQCCHRGHSAATPADWPP